MKTKTLLVSLVCLFALSLVAQEFNPPPDVLPPGYQATVLHSNSTLGLVQWGISGLGPKQDGGELWIQRMNPEKQHRYATLQAVGYFLFSVGDWSNFTCVAYDTEYNFTYAQTFGWLFCPKGTHIEITNIYINPADPPDPTTTQAFYTQYGASH